MEATKQKATAGESFIVAAMAIQIAMYVFEELPPDHAHEEALELLLRLKLAREVPHGPPAPVAALVAALAPHLSSGFPDDPSETDAVLSMTVAMLVLKDLSGLRGHDQTHIDALVGRPGWIPSLVKRARKAEKKAGRGRQGANGS